MCDALDIPRSTYYQSICHVESNRDRENSEITKRIIQIHNESKQRYGAPKIHHLLKEEGHSVSLKRVQRLMRKAEVRSIVKKKYKPYPSKEKIVERENLIRRDFSTKTINEKWVAYITYIYTLRDGWCYLASVMDLHSQKIVGHSFSRSMTANLVVKALANACDTQQPNNRLILHTDLGTQYTSDEFEQYAKSQGIKQSFSRKGCPYDNACIESFHAILKKEEVNHVQYLDYCTANLAMFQFIEGWYNRKRIHSRLGYKTPQTVEDLLKQSA
jgi:putative transposase